MSSSRVGRWVARIPKMVNTLSRQGGTMSVQMMRGGTWVFASYGIQQAITLTRSMILARLLSPADFGIISQAHLSTGALLIFTETGVWPALIQRSQLDAETNNTAWTILMIRGLLMTLAIFALSPMVGKFFGEPTLVPILRVMALTFTLSGCNSLSLALLQRELQFDRLTYVNIASNVASLIASVVSAYWLRSAWAFVVGELAGATTTLIGSYLVHGYRPRVRIAQERARELLNFGKYVTGSGVISYLTNQGVDAVVGRSLGAEALGLYGVGFRAANLPSTSISQVLNRVTLSAFSRVQDDVAHLRSIYLRTLRLTALLAFPLAVGMFAVAPVLIPALYGPKWTAVVRPFMVLCLFGLERSLGSIASPTFLALGKPRSLIWLGLVKLMTLSALILPLTHRYGILGSATAASISAVAVHAFVIPATSRLLGLEARAILGTWVRPAAGSVLMAAVIIVVQRVFPVAASLPWLLALTALGVIVYGVAVLRTEVDRLPEIWRSIVSQGVSD